MAQPRSDIPMTIETATYTSDLNVALPAHTDLLLEADSHMRLIKSTVKATFPNVTGAMTRSHTELNAAIITTGSQTVTGATTFTNNSGVALTVTGTGAGGAQVSLTGNGAVTPSKTIRARVGNLEIMDHANTSAIVVLTDAGDLSAYTMNAGTINQAGNPLVPAGVIVMWAGSLANIPTGWYLCNGLNGTPNLTDRFVVGAGLAYIAGNTGGNNQTFLATNQLPSHAHTITDSSHGHAEAGHSHGDTGHGHGASVDTQGGHNHTAAGYGNYIVQSGGASGVAPGGDYGTVSSRVMDSAGGHNHTVGIATGYANLTAGYANLSPSYTGITGTQNTGSGVGIENRPPYYALAFIMKS